MNDLELKSNWKNSGKVYQSINYKDVRICGSRNMSNTYGRFKKINFYKIVKINESILDIGCNVGALCLEAYKIGCKRIVGIDKPNIIEDAELIKKTINAERIEYYGFSISKCKLSELFNKVQGEFDHVFAMAIMMYVPQKRFWKVIKHYAKKTFWFETNHHPNEKKIKKLFIKNMPSHLIKNRWKIGEEDKTGKHFRIVYQLEKI